MEKRDYIDLIKVTDGVLKLEKGVEILSGKNFEEGEGASVYYLWEILRRNASEQFWYSDDFEIDTERYEMFADILTDTELTPEEKYEKLTA